MGVCVCVRVCACVTVVYGWMDGWMYEGRGWWCLEVAKWQ
jgi:hypothetical protein